MSASVSLARGRCASVITSAISGFPDKIPSVPAKTSASIEAAGHARLTLRMSGVVSSTSPSRRSATTSTRGLSGKASGFIAAPSLRRHGRRFAHRRFGFVGEPGQPAQGADTASPQNLVKPRAVGGKLRAIVLIMPQMQYAGGETPVLAAHAGVQEPDHKIGIFQTPASIGAIEAVDTVEIAARDREIASLRTLPALPVELAQRTERQPQRRQQPIDAAARAPTQQRGKIPLLRRQPPGQHDIGQLARQQDAVSGHEPSRLRERAMPSDKIGARQAIAVEEDAKFA